MTAAVSPPRSVRLTRRPTADPPTPLSSARNGRVTTGPDGIRSPPRPPGVRDRGRRPSRSRSPRPGSAGPGARLGSGGRSHAAAPGEPPGAPGRGGAVMWPPAPAAVRSRARDPHSSQSSSPGSSSAPPAATSSPIRAPDSRTGPVRTPRRRTARPASAGSSSTSKAIPVSRRSGALPPVAHPSSSAYRRARAASAEAGTASTEAGAASGDERGDGRAEFMSDEPPNRLPGYANPQPS